MSVINNNLLLTAPAAVVASYSISRSLRFSSADTSYLNRSFSSGNTKTWTWAGWVKRISPSGGFMFLFGRFNVDGTIGHVIDFGNDTIRVKYAPNGSYSIDAYTSAVFRDYSAWMHVVVAFDTTQSVQADRLKIYVNGEQQTLIGNFWSLNTDYLINGADSHSIGRAGDYVGQYFDGYLADIHYIGGQALAPTSFGQYDATTGVWVPKAYSGTYGTNGFHLDFADNSSLTTSSNVGIGKDTSGNGNYWVTNNLSITAGSANDSLVDSPTNGTASSGGDAGGVIAGNYATLNPVSTLTTTSLSNGNLICSTNIIGKSAIATIGMTSGKFYWEVLTDTGTTQAQVGVYGTSASTLYSLAANNTVYGIRFDATAGTLDYTSDGTSWTSIATGLTSGPYFPYFYNNGTTNKAVYFNFGQRSFSFAAPSGYVSLNTANLPTPSIAKPSTVMDSVLYTGTGSALTPTSSLAFSPDLVWLKSRSAATDHALYDTVRGAQYDIASNLSTAETTQTTGLTAFNSNGFTVGSLAKINTNAETYAAWCWDAGSSNASNTSGTINSTVRANTSAGFSVVTYIGNGTTGATIGHGLGVAPTWIMTKARGAAYSWNVYTTALDGSYDSFVLNTTVPKSDASPSTPTSTVFSVSNTANVNASGVIYIAYCWTPVAGLSRTFTWTGNGAADGPFVYLGFRPAFLLLKQATAASATNWVMLDSKRIGYNVDNNPLNSNLTGAEGTTDLVDLTASGFKIRSVDTSINASGGTYVGLAMAEAPFKYARAR